MRNFHCLPFLILSLFAAGEEKSPGKLSDDEKLQMQKEYYQKLDIMSTETSEELSSEKRRQELLEEEVQLLDEQLDTSEEIMKHKQQYIQALEQEIRKLKQQKAAQDAQNEVQ